MQDKEMKTKRVLETETEDSNKTAWKCSPRTGEQP